jgi:hypothetical protein
MCASTCRYLAGAAAAAQALLVTNVRVAMLFHAESCMQHQPCHSAEAEQCGCARGPAASITTCDGVRLRLITACINMHSHSSGASITSAVYQWA